MARLYRAVLGASWQEQQTITTFSYEASTDIVAGGASILANALGATDINGDLLSTFTPGTPLGTLQQAQREQMTYSSLYIYALYNDADFAEYVFESGTTGARPVTTSPLPPFVAASLRSNRTTRAIRRSFKRLAGFGEEDTGGAGAWIQDVIDALEDFADVLETSISGTALAGNATFQHVTISPERVETEDGIRYRKYQTEAEQLQHVAPNTRWAVDEFPTSQNSRKRGRGA